MPEFLLNGQIREVYYTSSRVTILGGRPSRCLRPSRPAPAASATPPITLHVILNGPSSERMILQTDEGGEFVTEFLLNGQVRGVYHTNSRVTI